MNDMQPSSPASPARQCAYRSYDWLVVGAGLTGATFARRVAETTGARVLVVDRRSHLAGNVFDAVDSRGIRVQQYGAHIFHTGARAIVEFLSRFSSWTPYEHHVLANIEGTLVPVPFNFTSLEILLPDTAKYLQRAMLTEFPAGARVGVAQLTRSTNSDIQQLGNFVVDTIFRGYSAKQWGRPLEQIDSAVLERVPVAMAHDNRYFRDDFQGLPTNGYTAMVSSMLDHPGITVALETDGLLEHRQNTASRTLWTGQIDAFFDYEYGRLPYRSLRFENRDDSRHHALQASVINHPGSEPFTRIIDHSYFNTEPTSGTVLTYEYPQPYEAGVNEPFTQSQMTRAPACCRSTTRSPSKRR